MSESEVLDFGLRSSRLALRQAYDQAIAAGKGWDDVFLYEGRAVVVGYAYYMLEYLGTLTGETDLKPKEQPRR